MTTATLHSATPLSNSALFRSFSARLSERQRAALSALAAGRPILAAAAAAGVHRSTLHGWLSHSEDFQAAYAALCRHQSEADSDLAAIARASLQALITDPATAPELRLRAIQTALKAVQARPATGLSPAVAQLGRSSSQSGGGRAEESAPLPAVARLGRGSSQSGGGRAEEGPPGPLPSAPPPPSPGSSEPTISAAERAALLATLRAARERLALLPPGSPAVVPLGRVSSQSGGGTAKEGSRSLQSRDRLAEPRLQGAGALFQSRDRQGAGTATPRNAPCPCGSKLKFKRCCGINAPPVLHAAAP